MVKQQRILWSILFIIIHYSICCPLSYAVGSGDLNNDGIITLSDAIPVLRVMVDQYQSTPEETGRGDLNNDGKLGMEDGIAMLQIIALLRPDPAWGTLEMVMNVTPSAAILYPGSTQNFSATVSNTSNTGVNWMIQEGASGGSFSGNGVYTAPSTAGRYHLIASSQADPEIQIRIPISVISPLSGEPNANKLLSLAYYHVQDSDGMKFREGVICVLVFDLNGVVYLYVADSANALSYKGVYSYSSGKLSLKFTAEDFQPDVQFSLDPASDMISMPFNVLSSAQGSSTWRRENASLEHNISALFYAVIHADVKVPASEAVQHVSDYVDARIMAELQNGKRNVTEENTVIGTEVFGNGITLFFKDGQQADISLYAWVSTSNLVEPLQLSPLANDPRVHINPTAPGTKHQFDPTNKTALYIAPFFTEKQFTIQNFPCQSEETCPYSFVNYAVNMNDNKDAMKAILKENDWNFHELLDQNVTLEKLIEEFRRFPGFIYFSTHGLANGHLLTGIYLGAKLDDALKKRKEILVTIRKNKEYEGIFTTYIQAEDGLYYPFPKEVTGIAAVPKSNSSDPYSYYLTIKPQFWEEIQSVLKFNFEDSMVYIAACETDQSNLREKIKSRAYFAYNVSAWMELTGTTFQYFVQHLSRNTHSPEEAYYNMVRIATTRQMIYLEDSVFQKIPMSCVTTTLPLNEFFKGYFFDGTKMKSYEDAGWLSQPAPGAIWWLSFAGRWGTDVNGPEAGVKGLKECWNQYWSKGTTGGLASPGCNAKSPGRVPTENEVAYANYLILGDTELNFSGIKSSRWTLNDTD